MKAVSDHTCNIDVTIFSSCGMLFGALSSQIRRIEVWHSQNQGCAVSMESILGFPPSVLPDRQLLVIKFPRNACGSLLMDSVEENLILASSLIKPVPALIAGSCACIGIWGCMFHGKRLVYLLDLTVPVQPSHEQAGEFICCQYCGLGA